MSETAMDAWKAFVARVEQERADWRLSLWLKASYVCEWPSYQDRVEMGDVDVL